VSRNTIAFVVVLLICVAAVLIFFQFKSNNIPEPGGNIVANVTEPDLSQVAEAGKSVFDRNCSKCHGLNAAGIKGSGPPLVHRIYEPNHHADLAFYYAVERGVKQHHWPFGNMPSIKSVSRSEVESIILYVRELQHANGIF